MKRDLVLAVRLAVRELRGGLSGFYVLIASIALGVAAITLVGVVSDALNSGLTSKGRTLLGGDLSFSLVQRRPSAAERTYISRFGRLSEAANLRSLARREGGDQTVLVDVKAVDKAYPLVGEVLLRGGSKLDNRLFAGMNAVVDPLLLARLGLKVGDHFTIADKPILIVGELAQEPDRLSERLVFGPRVLISQRTLLQTGLVRPGSLITWKLRLTVDPSARRDAAALKQIRNAVSKEFPEAGFRVRDRLNPTPGIKRAVDRFSQFMTLIGLAALFIGGIGVANAVASHVVKKRQVIATFKSLGGSSRLIFLTYLTQILLLAAVGIAIGLVVGFVTPRILNELFGDLLPIRLSFGVPLSVVFIATLYGFVVALIFMLWPLGQARRIRAAELYRAEIVTTGGGPGWVVAFVVVLLVALLVAVTVLLSTVKFISLYVCAAFLVLYFLFWGLALAVRFVVGHLPRTRNAELALVRASLTGPTPIIRTVVQSLGIGLSMLVTVALVQSSLTAELKTGLPSEAPNYFVLDIDKSEIKAFKETAQKTAPGVKVDEAPMLRGRIIALAGVPAEEIKPAPGSAWVLHGDRGLTFSDKLPDGSSLTEGKWWPKDYKGPPLVSFEQEAARGLGVKIGDKITVNVLGRNVEATIANLRRVDWESLSINFVMIFSPDTLAAAPYKLLATLTLPRNEGAKQEGKLISALLDRFPMITPIGVRETLKAINGVVEQVLLAVRLASSVILLAGAIALAGALAATHQQRVRETVIFKVLGATRRRILVAHTIEYLALALISGLIALAVGGLAAYLIVTFAMDLKFVFSSWAAVRMLTVVLLLILPLGLVGTWRILGQSTTEHLRRAE